MSPILTYRGVDVSASVLGTVKGPPYVTARRASFIIDADGPRTEVEFEYGARCSSCWAILGMNYVPPGYLDRLVKHELPPICAACADTEAEKESG